MLLQNCMLYIYNFLEIKPCLINSQTLKMICQVESFLCPDKQGTPEEGRRIQQPKRCVSINNNKDEDNSPKNHSQNIAESWLFSWKIVTFSIDLNIIFTRYYLCRNSLSRISIAISKLATEIERWLIIFCTYPLRWFLRVMSVRDLLLVFRTQFWNSLENFK